MLTKFPVRIKPATVTRIVKNLEKKNLITRRQSQHDNRSLQISLTPDGHRATKHIRKIWNRIEMETLEIITATEAGRIKKLLKLMRDGLGGKGP